MSFKTVIGQAESVTVIERSKFICSLKGVKDEEDAKEFVNFIRNKYSIANHNCYCYIADEKGLVRKFSDAGEPQGTAGLPMLNALSGRGICKTVAVVTRYFGGIKLGTGGLARAYSGAVIKALENAEIKELSEAKFITAEIPYEKFRIAERLTIGEVAETNFGERVTVTFAVKAENAEKLYAWLKDAFSGEAIISAEKDGYHAFS